MVAALDDGRGLCAEVASVSRLMPGEPSDLDDVCSYLSDMLDGIEAMREDMTRGAIRAARAAGAKALKDAFDARLDNACNDSDWFYQGILEEELHELLGRDSTEPTIQEERS